jgi:hypothetical protein
LVDAYVYWDAWHGPLYAAGFVYPPPGALLFVPAAVLSWPAFEALWLITLAAAALWLLWPLPVRLRLPTLIIVGATLAWGNAATLLAVPLALAPRYPALWSVLAWTKVTPAVGVVTLVRRRSWHSLACGLGACALVGAVTFVIAHDLLGAWVIQLGTHADVPLFLPGFQFDLPLSARLLLATAIAWAGAYRPWTLAVAATVATPDLSLATCGLLAAIPRLQESARHNGSQS